VIEFKISSFCSSGGCVEVGHSSAADAVIVRDSKDPMRSVSLRFSSAQWLASRRVFVAGTSTESDHVRVGWRSLGVRRAGNRVEAVAEP
jgi:hypothetical protein